MIYSKHGLFKVVTVKFQNLQSYWQWMECYRSSEKVNFATLQKIALLDHRWGCTLKNLMHNCRDATKMLLHHLQTRQTFNLNSFFKQVKYAPSFIRKANKVWSHHLTALPSQAYINLPALQPTLFQYVHDLNTFWWKELHCKSTFNYERNTSMDQREISKDCYVTSVPKHVNANFCIFFKKVCGCIKVGS